MNRATPCSGLDTVWIDKGLHVATKIRQAPQTATSSEMLQQATSFVARAQLSAASRSVRDASRDFSATEAPDTATMSMPSTPSLSGTWLQTRQPSRLAQISCVYWRSEVRRVGNEFVITCRSRWSAFH